MDCVLGDKTYNVVRAKLRHWLHLESIKEQLTKATDYRIKADLLCLYVSVAFDIPLEEIESLPWMEAAVAYTEICIANAITTDLPMFRQEEKEDERAALPWEYDGRTWFAWAHIFAKEYGWNIEYIAELEVDDAISLFQEIQVDTQLQKEWQWMLSENSIGYDEATKKHKFNPLNRPSWMIEIPPPPKSIKTLKSMMPVGAGVRYDDLKH